MEMIKEAMVLALFFSCYGETFGNTVVLSPANPVGDENGELELVCQLTPFPNATLRTVNWYRNTNLTRMQRLTSDCREYATGAGYNINLYSFTCSGNTFKMKILILLSSYNNDCWSCSVSFTNADETDKATACITVKGSSMPGNLLLLLLLLLLSLPIPIIIILICCGCLDCCRCCRIFDHNNGKEHFSVTCYCSKKGCCSFFFCTPGSKMGWCLCGQDNEKGRCGGCRSCQKKCGCGWPSFCTSKKMRSCGSCYCSCCVEEAVGKGLDETTEAMTGPQAFYAETKNKVHPLPTKLPPVELKEPIKKKKKKNKGEKDLEKSAGKATRRNSPEDQDIPGEKLY